MAAATQGVVGVVVGAVVAVLVLALTWAPVRKRWLFEWAAVGLRYATRRRTLAAGAPPAAFAELVCPGTTVVAAELAGENAAMISDGYGLTAVLEIGDRAGLLGEQARNLPPLATLLPPANAENPPVRLQLLLTAAPAPVLATGNGPAGTSYRQLTDGRLLAQERVLLAVRVSRTEGWSTEDLRRALSSAVRKVRRRLDETPAQLLGDTAATRVVAELALHDEAEAIQESWKALRVGGQAQAVFRLRRWPGGDTGQDGRLVARFLALPATTTTVAISAGPWSPAADETLPVGLSVRLAAPTAAELNLAAQALRQAAKAEGTEVRPVDGEQLDGLAATLPLGGGGQNLTLAAADVNRLALPLGLTGLMVGRNRQGAPMTLRLFRPEPTRMTLVGGVRAAQLMALRAMALGARVVVQTYRPHAWEPFIRGATMPGQVIPMLPPGRPVGEVTGTPWQPTLIVSDCGPAENNQGPAGPGTGPGWQATLVVRGAADPRRHRRPLPGGSGAAAAPAGRRGVAGRVGARARRGGGVADEDAPGHGGGGEPADAALGDAHHHPDRDAARRSADPARADGDGTGVGGDCLPPGGPGVAAVRRGAGRHPPTAALSAPPPIMGTSPPWIPSKAC